MDAARGLVVMGFLPLGAWCYPQDAEVERVSLQQALVEILAEPENRLPRYRPLVWTAASSRRDVPLVLVAGASASYDGELDVALRKLHDVDGDGRLTGEEEASARDSERILRSEGWRTPFLVEMPEYVWAYVPGDPSNDSPFFYGRSMDLREDFWKIRYPPLKPPVWEAPERGWLELSAPLEGGYVQHLRVTSDEGMFVLWCGVTNESQKPLEHVRGQLCVQSRAAGFSDRSLGCVSVPVEGEVFGEVPHDVRAKEGSHSERPPCFMANVKGLPPPASRLEHVVALEGNVDMAAIAALDPVFPDRYLVLYSPSAPTVFFNAGPPCIHANPVIRRIDPGETRWGATFCMVFQGDLGWFFDRLREIDERFAGVPLEPRGR